MSKRSGNSRRSTRSKRRERREEEKEERLLHIFARFSIATIALYRKGNRWISGLIKKFQRSLLLSQSAENSGSDFSSREEISLSTMSVRSLGSFFFFFLSSYFPRRLHRLFVGLRKPRKSRTCPEEIHCAWPIYRQENVEGEYGEFLTGLSSPSLRFPSLMRPSSDDQRR